MPSTPRHGFFYPDGSHAPDLSSYLFALAEDLDDHAKDLTGTLAARPAAAQAGRFYFATDKGIIYRDTGLVWVSMHSVPYITAWPPPAALAVDGMEIDYAPSGGQIWKLRYRDADPTAYKWQVISAPAIWAQVLADQTRASDVYGDLGTIGPAITLPREGDYFVEIGCNCWEDYSGTTTVRMSYAIGATAASHNDATQAFTSGANLDNNDNFSTHYRGRRKNDLAAATVLTAKYNTSGTTITGHWRWRWIRARPIRII